MDAIRNECDLLIAADVHHEPVHNGRIVGELRTDIYTTHFLHASHAIELTIHYERIQSAWFTTPVYFDRRIKRRTRLDIISQLDSLAIGEMYLRSARQRLSISNCITSLQQLNGCNRHDLRRDASAPEGSAHIGLPENGKSSTIRDQRQFTTLTVNRQRRVAVD